MAYGIDVDVTLFHGSLHKFDKIDLNRGLPYKDFGKGFYTTFVKKHAVDLATRNRNRLKTRNSTNIDTYLYSYKFDMNRMSDVHSKKFDRADIDWMRFVLANRKSRTRAHDYDVVIGPTANDAIVNIIEIYEVGLYGPIGSDEAIATLIRLAESFRLPNQVYFGTKEALDLLIFQKRECNPKI